MQLEDEVAPDSDEFLFFYIKSDNHWVETFSELIFHVKLKI